MNSIFSKKNKKENNTIFDDGTEILASDEKNYNKKYEEWEKNKK